MITSNEYRALPVRKNSRFLPGDLRYRRIEHNSRPVSQFLVNNHEGIRITVELHPQAERLLHSWLGERMNEPERRDHAIAEAISRATDMRKRLPDGENIFLLDSDFVPGIGKAWDVAR